MARRPPMTGAIPRDAVLVTGGTGFIGRHVLRELLARGRAVVTLARSRGGQPARQRVARVVGPALASRVHVVEADLSQRGLGLTAQALREIRAGVATVVHCAGDATLFPDDLGAFRRIVVEGPVELLRRLAGGAIRRWAHVSTAFVCGRRGGRVLASEGDVGQVFRNPYERVKLE